VRLRNLRMRGLRLILSNLSTRGLRLTLSMIMRLCNLLRGGLRLCNLLRGGLEVRSCCGPGVLVLLSDLELAECAFRLALSRLHLAQPTLTGLSAPLLSSALVDLA
jgi:hypothetical protein